MTYGISRKIRVTLLAGVSAGALLLAIASDADAQGTKWWFEGTGQYLNWDGGASQFYPDPNAFIKPGNGAGFGAEIGFQAADSPWSFALRGRYSQNKRKDGSFVNTVFSSYGSFTTTTSSGTASSQETHGLLDFEVGRDVGLGVLGIPESKLTVTAGVRVARFSARTAGDATSPAGFYTTAIRNRRKFTGVGPRLGFKAAVPVSNNVSFKLDAAGALLFGKRKASLVRSGSYGTTIRRRSKSAIVPNIDVFAGVALHASSAPFELIFGYGVDAYFNVLDTGYNNARKSNRILHGPRIKGRFYFN